jgi:hypothetical protein
MKLAIMQPYLFPYIGYFQLIHAVDVFVIYDDVNFIKQGWINRNYILVNGKKHCLTLETKGASSYKHINQISIKPDRIKIKKTLRQNYSKAPFFHDIDPLLEKIIDFPTDNLSFFVGNSIQEISLFLGIPTKFIISSQLGKNAQLTGQEKVIDICQGLGASIYINSIGGQSLYVKDEFNKNGITLYFLKTRKINYPQWGNEFIPDLSIIDVLMHNSKKIIIDFLSQFELV